MKFKKIVCIDKTKLKPWAIEELQEHSEEKITNYTDYPKSQEEVIDRIGDAEVVFVSWHTKLDEEVIKQCPNLQYIGMCCSLYDDESANVAVNFARDRGITVTGIRDYGDPGVVEFIISELVRIAARAGRAAVERNAPGTYPKKNRDNWPWSHRTAAGRMFITLWCRPVLLQPDPETGMGGEGSKIPAAGAAAGKS
jgi:lactate dehydrogenase-like 2-hydroxyacid dehydrogenase